MNKYCNYVRHPITNVVMAENINIVEKYKYTETFSEMDQNGNLIDVTYDCIYFSGSIYEIDEPSAVVKYATGLKLKPNQIQSSIPIEPNFIIGKNIKNVKSYVSINGKNCTKWTHSFNGRLFYTFRKGFLNPNVYVLGTIINEPTSSQMEWCINYHPDWIYEGTKIKIPESDDRVLFSNGNFEPVSSTVGNHSHSIDISHKHQTNSIEHSHRIKGSTITKGASGNVPLKIGSADNILSINSTNAKGSTIESAIEEELIDNSSNESIYNKPDRIKLLWGIFLV